MFVKLELQLKAGSDERLFGITAISQRISDIVINVEN